MSEDSKDTKNEPRFRTLERLKVEKERLNEKTYRALYTELLQKHKGVLAAVAKEDAADFEEERKLISKALKSEKVAIFAGFAVGLTVFVSLRIFPRMFVRKYGGEAKIKALEQADEISKNTVHGVIKEMLGILVEGSFAIWAGTRGYNAVSELSGDTFELIAGIPLVGGRSIVAENLCKEWIEISHERIPTSFWENVQAGNLKSPNTWRAIQKVCDNCVKRDFYEKQIRNERTLRDNDPVSLTRSVPENILSATSIPLTGDEARQMTTDTSS